MIGKQVDGFLLVDKPTGWTSHDVVAKTRGIIQGKKIGHAGTLDPLATGLLVLGVGRATRLLRFVQKAPKEYVACAQLGVATDTLDSDGATLTREPMQVSEGDFKVAMERFRGGMLQVPPMVSARKVEGKRLYELARAGKEIEREARPIRIHELELTDFAPSDYPVATFRVLCSAGTYVRTLADDIARSLGGRAHLTALRRTRNGNLGVSSAVTMMTLHAAGAGGWRVFLMTPREGLPDLPELEVGDELVKAISNGLAMPAAVIGAHALDDGPIRIVSSEGRLLAIYGIAGQKAVPEVVLS